MTFAELKDALEKLTTDELNQDIELWPEYSPIQKIKFIQHQEAMFADADDSDEECRIITKSKYDSLSKTDRKKWLSFSFVGHPCFIEDKD